MVNFKEDERLTTLNHSCAHVMAQAVQASVPSCKILGRTCGKGRILL